MKRLRNLTIVLLVLAVLVLASGCSYYRAKKAQKQAEEQHDQYMEEHGDEIARAQQQAEAMQQGQYEYDVPSEPEEVDEEAESPTKQYDDEYNPDESPEVIKVGDEGTGLEKLGTQYREKTASEHCDVDYPFSCMSYLARDGFVDVTLKYQAYKGMLKEVTLYFKGDPCDPQSISIEPGDKQEFTCYADESGSQVSGDLEIEYYETLDRAHFTKTGSLAANWE